MNLEVFLIENIDWNDAQFKRIWELYFSANVGVYSGALHGECWSHKTREPSSKCLRQSWLSEENDFEISLEEMKVLIY
jgi:hypothetical protein